MGNGVEEWKLLILLKMAGYFYPIKFHGQLSRTQSPPNQMNPVWADRIRNKRRKQFALFYKQNREIQITFTLSADKVRAIGKRSQMSKPF